MLYVDFIDKNQSVLQIYNVPRSKSLFFETVLVCVLVYLSQL